MDNITHSLTGALFAKYIESRPSAPEDKDLYRRTFFWLFVLCANLPDIDVLPGLLGDPTLTMRYHRGITHSLLFAPFLALVPATLFFFWSKVKNIRLLWIISVLGIVLHIFFDLVTSFGTQILSPLSDTRYALDWMFIIDPWFTAALAIILLLGKLIPSRARIITSGSFVFIVVYIIVSAVSHNSALFKLYNSASKLGIGWTRLSAIPQPLSLFRWNGLVQSDEGALQSFYSVFDDSLQFRIYPHANDEFAERAIQNPDMHWYLNLARHPIIRSFEDGEHHIVEVRDLMFSVDDALLKSFGFAERSLPFSMTCVYDSSGNLLDVTFDGKKIGGK